MNTSSDLTIEIPAILLPLYDKGSDQHRFDDNFFREVCYYCTSLSFFEDIPRECLEYKVLYAHWNFVLDDDFDKYGSVDSMIESRQVLTRFLSQADSVEADSLHYKTVGAKILYTMLRSVSIASVPIDSILFEIQAVLLGMEYEALINKSPALGSLDGYLSFSTLTARIGIFFELESFLHSKASYTTFDYSIIRSSLFHLQVAFKLAADISTAAKEVEEGNLNIFYFLHDVDLKQQLDRVNAIIDSEYEQFLSYVKQIKMTSSFIKSTAQIISTYRSVDVFVR